MRAVVFLCLLGSILATDVFKSGKKRYDGYTVLKIYPKNHQEQSYVQQLTEQKQLDVWSVSHVQGQPVTVLIPPAEADDVRDFLEQHSMHHQTQTENVQQNIDHEMHKIFQKYGSSKRHQFDLDDFNTYEDIMEELDKMINRCPSESVLCDTGRIGKSYQRRDLKLFSIVNTHSDHRGIWLDSGIHAREWLGPATLLKILNHLISNYDSDETVRNLVDNYNWFFLPVMNPDGYVYSWEQDRYWRKSVNLNKGSDCIGTDLNRNYDAQWGAYGTSTEPCSYAYGGETAASASETQAVQKVALLAGPVLDAWISIHSYSSMWLMPYGHLVDGKCYRSSDFDDMLEVVEAMADATEATYNTTWSRGSICETIYPASGGTIDFVKGKAGVKYAFTPELRGNDFVVPSTEIEPSFREIWNAVVAMVDAIDNL